ncbi:unnamed protein product [Acanthoscelides obtectus]|uniref:MADF domain-containing protein n=1 Tax=Acanthoscelides obtectus TaxID=200917 RepID=A0A9P0MGM4_ACAOB|nr:unnamed protein product [Acanthoscelides obtectus]CAK1680396.1 hypothetical protein AOBTE_LOCUS32618 [Acanthoscelides obtectus]
MKMIYSIEELKKKEKRSLMSTYRLYRKKILDSTRSGSSVDDIFKPNWFAYDLMDSFLAPIYDKTDTYTINTESMKFPDEDSTQNNLSAGDTSTPSVKKRRESEISEVRAQMKTAVNVLKNISDRPRVEVDEVDLYCQLLAKKTKKI